MPEGATRPSVPNKGKEPHAPCPCPDPRHPAGRPGVRGLIFKYLAYLKGKSTGIISMWLHLEIDTDKQIQIYSEFFFFFNTFEAQAGKASNLVSEREQEGG